MSNEQPRELIPEGWYNARAVKVKDVHGSEQWVVWGKSGNEQTDPEKRKFRAAMKLRVMEGDYDGWEGVWFGYCSPKAWENTIEQLRACGFEGDDVDQANSQDLGQPVRIVIEHEEYDGKTYARVGYIVESGSGALIESLEPLKPEEMRNFAAEMKARMTGSGPAALPSSGRSGGDPGPSDADKPW